MTPDQIDALITALTIFTLAIGSSVRSIKAGLAEA